MEVANAAQAEAVLDGFTAHPDLEANTATFHAQTKDTTAFLQPNADVAAAARDLVKVLGPAP
jgi:hypothetical protein